MKVLFMGTPEFADTILKALINTHEVVAVVSQPDKPQGRKREIIFSPVKKTAIENNIEVLQPERIRGKDVVQSLKEYNADIFIVAAYGQILPERVLNIPKYGCINVHASLLPKYRGAAPIQWSIINGEKLTGVTIQKMDKGMDTGEIILAKPVEILPEDTGGSLYIKLADAGASALLEAMVQIEEGTANYIKQNESEATYAPMITKETGFLDFNKTADEIVNLARGIFPWESANAAIRGENLKIWGIEKASGSFSGTPGELVEINKKGLVVKTADSAVLITEVQGKGGKRMKAADYARGRRIEM